MSVEGRVIIRASFLRKAMCYVTAAVVFGFFFLYWVIGRMAARGQHPAAADGM